MNFFLIIHLFLVLKGSVRLKGEMLARNNFTKSYYPQKLFLAGLIQGRKQG